MALNRQNEVPLPQVEKQTQVPLLLQQIRHWKQPQVLLV